MARMTWGRRGSSGTRKTAAGVDASATPRRTMPAPHPTVAQLGKGADDQKAAKGGLGHPGVRVATDQHPDECERTQGGNPEGALADGWDGRGKHAGSFDE
jgi:hypothetical protein